MPRSKRLIRLLQLLQDRPGAETDVLARACGISPRTLLRDLDALSASGFPVYFDHGYRLAAPTLLPPVTLAADEALALRLAAQTAAARAEPATARTLTLAAEKLQQALAVKPPDPPAERQLALELPVRDPQTEACVAALTAAIAERRPVKLAYRPPSRQDPGWHRADPYRLLGTLRGLELLAYSHDRRRMVRIPVSRLAEVSILQRRFRPLPARLLERHLHGAPPGRVGPQQVRLICRPPLAQALRERPPMGMVAAEEGAEGSVIFTLAAMRAEELVPWLLACGEAVEVLEPADLRQEMHRIAGIILGRHAPPSPDSSERGRRGA